MSGSVSSLGLERRSSFNKPTTPKRLGSEQNNSVGHTRVEDESVIEKKYSFGEVLGQGSFGVVREVTNRTTEQHFAMKIVHKDKPGSNSIVLLEREVEVLKRVNHPSIIQLEEVFETAQKMYLIMELCKGGELSEELKKRTYFKEEDAKVVMKRLTESVVYMHDNDMVHRDLKLENVLLSTADPNDPLIIKVSDFGLVHMKGLPGCDDLMTSKCGTLYYMAPEVFTRDEYSKMCDVWSLGVIMYTLLCGRVPFHSDSPVKLEELILEGNPTFSEVEWYNVSQIAKDLIKSMLCVDTTTRYTARRILDDPWFTGNPAKRTLNALELMRTLDSETTHTTTGSPKTKSRGLSQSSLETLHENEMTGTPSLSSTSESATQSRTSLHTSSANTKKHPTKLAGRSRAQSSSSLMNSTGGGGNLKFPSTSTLSGKNHSAAAHSTNVNGNNSSSRLRSMSTGSRSVNVQSNRRPNSARKK